MTSHANSPPSSQFASMPKVKTPEDTEIIELFDSDDEDTKEGCSVKDSTEDIEEKKPAAKVARAAVIDNLCNELQEVFKLLRTKEKRKLNDACETPEAKKRKVSDATEESSRLKDAPTTVVTPNQTKAYIEPKRNESYEEGVEAEFATTAAASSASNENSNFEALVKTAGEEQQRLQDTTDVDLSIGVTVQHEDLVDECMPAEASEVDGTPYADDYLSVEAPQDPNCLAIEKSAVDTDSVALPTTKGNMVEASTESVYESDAAPNEQAVEYAEPEEMDRPEDAELLVEYKEETCDHPVNSGLFVAIQCVKQIFPPSFGTCLLFVCGLYCSYVDRSAALKLALCLPVYCANIGNAVMETETGDEPVFCISLPANASRSWRALVLAFYTIGMLGVLNLVCVFGEKIVDRILIEMHQA
ncbi:MAG: hypothetical protein SGBAC_003548 [Bacillariaceae sp.]